MDVMVQLTGPMRRVYTGPMGLGPDPSATAGFWHVRQAYLTRRLRLVGGKCRAFPGRGGSGCYTAYRFRYAMPHPVPARSRETGTDGADGSGVMGSCRPGRPIRRPRYRNRYGSMNA